MAQLRWTSQALADLEAVGDFIARDAPFAQVFVDRSYPIYFITPVFSSKPGFSPTNKPHRAFR